MNETGRFDYARYTADDVADCLLNAMDAMSAMKLQKLVYYCQAWSLVWDERPLFDAPIEAWENGPVIPDLFRKHRDQFIVFPHTFKGHPDRLDADARETIEAIIRYYGSHTAQWLSDLTHAEDPWKQACARRNPEDNRKAIIDLASLHLYYSGLLPNES